MVLELYAKMYEIMTKTGFMRSVIILKSFKIFGSKNDTTVIKSSNNKVIFPEMTEK